MATEIGIKLTLDGVKGVVSGIDKMKVELVDFGQKANAAGDTANKGFTKAAQGVRSISEQLENAKNTLLAYVTVGQLVEANNWATKQASDLRQLQDRIQSVTQSTAEAGNVFATLMAQSNKWGSAVDETANAFARLNPAVKAMGLGSSDTLRMLDGLSASLRLSGATTAETTAVLLQFSQAMGSGRVGGDEFRSMMENAQPLMSAVAKQLGVSTGALRQMSEEGRLTSSTFANALMPAIQSLVDKAQQIAPTVGQAMQALKNNALKDFGREFEGLAISSAKSMGWLADHTLEAAAAAHALSDAVIDLAGKLSIAAGVGGVGAMALSMGSAAAAGGGLAAALAEVNIVSAALLTSAAMSKLEKLSTFGKAGLLGAVFFGSYEIGAWIGAMESVRSVVGQLLEPVFKAVDLAGSDSRRKAQLAIEDAKKQLADLQALKTQGVTAQFVDSTVLGFTSKKRVPIDDLISQAQAGEKSLTDAYEKMYAAPAQAQAKAAPLNRASAAGEYEALTKDLKYREKIIVEYDTKLKNLQKSYTDLAAPLTGEKLENAQKRQQSELAALMRERKAALEGAGDYKESQEAAKKRLESRIAAFEKNQTATDAYYKQEAEAQKAYLDQGIITESTYLERKKDLDTQRLTYDRAIATAELTAVQAANIKPEEKLQGEIKYNAELGKLKQEAGEIFRKYNADLNTYFAKQSSAAFDAAQKDIDALTQSNKALELHNQEIGLTTEQLDQLTLYRQRAAISTLEQAIAEQQAMGIVNENLQQQIELLAQLKKQRDLTAQGQIKEAAKTLDEANKKTAQAMEKDITDALMRGFENGKGFAENFATTVENMFKTMVLRPVVQATVQGGLNAIGAGGVFGGGAAGGASGSSSIFSGTALAGSTFALGMEGTIATIAEQGFISGFGSAMASASTLASTGTFAGSLGAIGAAMPYIAATVAAAKVLQNITGGQFTSAQNTGDASAAFAAGNGSKLWSGPVTVASASADQFVQSLQDSYTKAAQTFGIKLAETQFSYGSNSGQEGQHPNVIVRGSAGASGYDSGETAAANLQLEATRAVFAALKGSDLPQYLAKVFDGIAVGSATIEQINAAQTYAAQLKAVRDALTETREPLQILKDNVATATAALGTSAASFKADFVAAIDAGISPDKLAQWQGLGTALDELAKASGTAAVSVRSAADILSERTRLQDQLDQLTMTSTQLLDKQRNALDASNQGLFDQVQAATAAKTASDAATQAAKDQADAAKAAADAAKAAADASAQAAAALASTNKTWQDQLDVLTGAQTERSIALRDATDASTKALMQQVYAQQDLKAAAEAGAAALKAMTSATQSIAVSKAKLGGASSADVAVLSAQYGLDSAVQAIKDLGTRLGNKDAQSFTASQIEAVNLADYAGQSFVGEFATLLAQYYSAKVSLTDAQTAAAAKPEIATPTPVDNSAANAIASQRQGLQDQLDQLTLTNTQLLAKQRNALDESNRALFDQVQTLTAAKTAAAEAATLADRLAIANGSKTSVQVQRANELAAALNDQNRATLRAIYAAEDLSAAHDKQAQATKDATSAAFAGVQRAVDAQRKLVQTQLQVANESVSSLKSIFDTLKGGLNSLYGSANSSGTSATAFLTNALATAKASGYLPDAAQLSDAVSAAISGTQGAQYATQADSEFAKLALAGTLTGLKDITGNQLTTAEQAVQLAQSQLDALDQQLIYAQAQIDAVNGVDTSVKSVQQAIIDLIAATRVQAAATGSAGSGVSGNGGPVVPVTTTVANSYLDAVTGKSDPLALVKAFQSAGKTSAEMAAALGASTIAGAGSITADDIRKFAVSNGLPSFDVGTNLVPRDMLALVHQGEAIVPAAYNPANNGGMGGGNTARLEALVEALTAEVQRLQAIVATGNQHQRRTADTLDNVTEGGSTMRTVVAA